MGLIDWLAGLFSNRQRPRPQRPLRPLSSTTPQVSASVRPIMTPGQITVGRSGTQPAPVSPPQTPKMESKGSKQLDLSRFAPISEAELKKKSNQQFAWNELRLNRIDVIPPTNDPRTNLIDRALVSNGYLTPEQLVEIHEVGDLYNELRPSLAMVHTMAQQAVADDVEARKQRKAEKQAEAKARRELHAKAVAERKANDIVFLGRGVSTGLADRRADIEKLQTAGLPTLATASDVARVFGLTIPRLRWLAFHSESTTVSHYIFFTVPKKTGGVRRLSAPHRDLAAAQRKIYQEILLRLPTHANAHGFVPGRSILTNAQPHVGAKVVVNLDLKDFFPSIVFPRIRGILTATGFSPCAATILALICTEAPRQILGHDGQKFFVATGPRALPQGACTSPALANLASRALDARLAGLAKAWGWTYTRYADDLTFSSMNESVDIGRMLTAIRNVVTDEGFTVNEEKTKIQRRSQAQEVTGLVVNQRPKAPRQLIRRIRAILHQARRHGLAAQNREGHENFEAWLGGMIAYIAMTDKNVAQKFRIELEQINLR